MQRVAPGAIAAMLAVGACTPVVSQDLPEGLEGFLGHWVMTQDDTEAPGCPIDLLPAEAGGGYGYAIALPQACPPPYPPADAIHAWRFDDSNGSITLLDPSGQVVLRFMDEEDGHFATDPDEPPVLYLLPEISEDGMDDSAQ